MACEMIKIFLADALTDHFFFFSSAHICPDQSVSKRLALFIHTDAPHHLATEGYGGNVVHVDVLH